MRMLSHTRLFQAAVVAAGIVAVGAADGLARSHGSYGSYGSYGSSGSSASYGSSSSASYGSSSSASYASYGSSGSSASYGRPGLFARWHARKAAKHSSGSSASYGAHYASSSGSSASYGSASYGSSGSSGSYGGTMYYSAPAGVEVAPADGVPSEPPAAPIDTAASISVKVPTDAVVFVNDRPTTSTGAERSFVSRGLSSGRTYAYQLRVEFNRDGEKVVENKLVRLQAGQEIELSFGSGDQVASGENAETDLTLHVPAEAKITLAGAATHQTGELRTFATDSLTQGQEWAGYVVRVELERDGKTIVQEKTLSIVGGENYELKFDFADGAAQVASLN